MGSKFSKFTQVSVSEKLEQEARDACHRLEELEELEETHYHLPKSGKLRRLGGGTKNIHSGTTDMSNTKPFSTV